MFTTLSALAQQATLMITIAPEGDGQLRVNVTPMPADTKAKSKLPAPLSLLGTPTEFDADFVAALSTWQAPKRTLLEQAQAAAGGAAPAASTPALPAPKPEAKNETDKPARRGRASKGGDEKKVDSIPAATAAVGEAAPAADQVIDATVRAGAGDQLPGGDGAESSISTTGTSIDAAAAPSSTEASTAPAADAAPAPAAADGEEPIDKFTLDLF